MPTHGEGGASRDPHGMNGQSSGELNFGECWQLHEVIGLGIGGGPLAPMGLTSLCLCRCNKGVGLSSMPLPKA